jgi:UDP-glucose 4-epimerase
MTVRRALITGAAGFLGTYVATACRKQGIEIHGVDLHPPRVRDEWATFRLGRVEDQDLAGLLESSDFTYCFHLAGGASVRDSMVDPIRDFDAVMPSTVRVLHAMGTSRTKAVLVVFSSAAVYGHPVRLPITEDDAPKPLSPYGVHKLLVETLSEQYSRLFGLKVVVVRIFSAFGDGLRKQLFWDICEKRRDAITSGSREIRLSGTGEETRDFIHAEDVADAALLCAKAQSVVHGFDTYNVASGVGTSIASAARALLGNADKLSIIFNGQERPGDPHHWVADISKLRGLGFRPSRSLADGLPAYLRWYETQEK